MGPEASAARALEPAERPARAGREHPRLPTLELDRNRHLAVHPRRKHSDRAALFRQGARSRRPRQLAAHAGAAVRAAAARRATHAREVPHALARLLALHRRRPIGRRHGAEDHRGARRHAPFRAPAPRHRPRSGRVDGVEEARRIFLMSGLLRVCTAGSVDDGKSTLIGRLLHDSRSVYEDQISSVKKASANRVAGPIDFSLFTDGLRAEREQGITIDVAYRYFATARRKFILADTP